jgi:hypothetical protein
VKPRLHLGPAGTAPTPRPIHLATGPGSLKRLVTGAFAAWMKGTGYVTSIFADDMTWEITDRDAMT